MKIIIIGGGSYSWAFGFVRQFVCSGKLKSLEVVLVDTDPEALGLVYSAAGRFNRNRGNPLRLRKSLRLEPVLDQADFVIAAVSTGGLAAMRHDLEIPAKYGILHTVGDTVGPGGWMRAVRNIPVFHDFARLMRAKCPQAWFINVSNPLTVLTRVPHKYFGIKAVGMCPGVEGAARALAGIAGASDQARMDFTVTGIDHGSWFTSLFADGLDVLQKLKAMGYCRSDDRLPSAVSAEDPLAARAVFRADFAVWREVGYMPAIGDRHAVENWPWFILGNPARLPFGIKRTSIADRRKGRRLMRAKLKNYLKNGQESAMGHGDDPIAKVVEALGGHGSFLWASNYRNVGQIPALPPDAVVETRCLFDAAGVNPLCAPMPAVLQAMVLPHVLRQEAIADIALQGTFDELVALVQTDPLCSRLPLGACRKMVREMLWANKSLIKNKLLLKT